MSKFLFVFLSFIFFNLNAESSETDTATEAGFNYDSKMGSDFCCDRAHKTESAHDLSDQASQGIVDRTLYSSKSKPSRPAPSGGQR